VSLRWFSLVTRRNTQPSTAQYAINRWADPGYFAAMGIPILRGHSFDSDRRLDKANQAVVSASFVHQYFPNEDPIGKHIDIDRKYEIVGVVGDTRFLAAKAPEPIQYFPLLSGLFDDGTLVICPDHDVEQLAVPVQRVVQNLDRDLPVSDVLTMDQLLGSSAREASVNATLLAAFAALSLILGAAGLFGVLSYLVAQRTNEIGIRIGARSAAKSGVWFDAPRRIKTGAIGTGSRACGQCGSRPTDSLHALCNATPRSRGLCSCSRGDVRVAAAACLVPAWRASRIDPMSALRTE
jgi:type IV secretory pathway TrbD component